MAHLGTSLYVFIFIVAADVAWAKYIAFVANGSTIAASNFSMLVYIFGALAITEYVKNKWMLIPACLGAWTGTFLGMITK